MLFVWFIVVFMVECYIGVCYLLWCIDICFVSSVCKIVVFIYLFFFFFVFYKLFFIGVFVSVIGEKYCMIYFSNSFVLFVLDSVYGLLIIFVLLIIIFLMNFLIINKFFVRKRK